MRGITRDLLLLAATSGEAQGLAAEMAHTVRTSHAGKVTITGELAGRPCRLAYTGIGTVNAAQALTHAIETRRPKLVLQFGIAGAYVPAGLEVGMVACATEEIYGDVGVLAPDGWHPADLMGFPLVFGVSGDPSHPSRFNHFPLDAALVNRVADLTGARAGPFLTLSQCTGVRAFGDRLHARFGALCESMEGAAAAHVCALYDVPFLELRGISNLVEDRNRPAWDIPGAVAAVQHAVLRVVARLDDLAAE